MTSPNCAASGAKLVVAVLGVLLLAPTSGDIGGCGDEARELDGQTYGEARKEQDCKRCAECGVATARCGRACDGSFPPDILLPATCRPLYHDGRVCLRAIEAASCATFATYVDDVAPAVPSECDFCQVVGGAP